MKMHSFLDHLGRIRLNSIDPCCCILPNDKDYASYIVFSGRPHQVLCSSLFLTEASPTRRCCSSSLARVILMVQGLRGVNNPMLSHQSRRVFEVHSMAAARLRRWYDVLHRIRWIKSWKNHCHGEQSALDEFNLKFRAHSWRSRKRRKFCDEGSHFLLMYFSWRINVILEHS